MQRDNGKIRLAQGRVVLIKIIYLSLSLSLPLNNFAALPDQQAAVLSSGN